MEMNETLNRENLINRYENIFLSDAMERFELNHEDITSFDAYEGCANLVYACRWKNVPVILRLSFRQDRTLDQINAELHFINYLGGQGMRVSQPIRSRNGLFVEELILDGLPLYLVCFKKGPGMRVPDNDYRYREDAPIEEYFQNWGAVLGQMHALTKTYQPLNQPVARPDWFSLHAQRLDLEATIPPELSRTRDKIRLLLNEVRSLPKDKDSYGLIHGDFNDGNFTVDYSNGDITVFDFDDCCYFWLAYELACAWEGGIGRIMFRGLQERKGFMDYYMEQVFEGYFRENTLPQVWLDRIPLFIKLIQVEEFMHFVQYFHDTDKDTQSHLNYLIMCIEQDLPYMGFFDPIYSPQQPFRKNPSA